MSIALRIGALFFIAAFIVSSWLTRLPDVLVHLGVNKATMGAALFAGPVGALVIAPFTGRFMHRFSPAAVGAFGVFVLAVLLVGLGLAPHWLVFAGVLFFCGVASGLFEIGANFGAQRLEQRDGRKYMSQCHGFWSLGYMMGAIAAGLFGQAGVPIGVHLPIVAVATFAAMCVVFRKLPVPMFEPTRNEAASGGKQRAFALPSRAAAGVCAMVIGVTLAEGAIYDWGTLYMRETVGANPFWASVGYATFTLTMAFGRLGGDKVRERLSGSTIVRGSSALCALGLAAFIFAPNVAVAAVALGLMGVGVSMVMPVGVAAAGLKAGDPAQNVAAMSMMLTAAFLMAPPGVGFVAEHFGLTTAFLMMIPFVILTGLFAGEADPPRRVVALDPEPAAE